MVAVDRDVLLQQQDQQEEEGGQWSTQELLLACACLGLTSLAHQGYWSLGRVQNAQEGPLLVWQVGMLPKLEILKQIQGKTLDKLEEYMSQLLEEEGSW